MNLMTILGIGLIAIGTLFLALGKTNSTNTDSKKLLNKYYNKLIIYWKLILGIILVGCGTYLTISENYNKGDRDSTELKKEFKKEIQSTKETIKGLYQKSEISNEDVTKIDTEFTSWANEFIRNIDYYKLKNEKKIIENKNNQITLNEKWLPFYQDFFITLGRMIETLNIQSTSKISKNIPTIPYHLFSKSASQFIAKIKFPNNVVLIFILQNRLTYLSNSLPSIEIFEAKPELFDKQFEFNKEYIPMGGLGIEPLPERSKIRIDQLFSDLKISELKPDYDLNDYHKSIKEILKTILQDKLIR